MKKLTLILILATVGSIGLLMSTIGAQDVHDARQFTKDGVAVTLYNQGSALIRERRTFDLRSGLNRINFSDVAATIDPTSVGLVSLTDPTGTFVLEQNYVYDLVNSGALIERYLDEQVEVTTFDGDHFTGELLSGRGSLIIREADGAVVEIKFDQVSRLQFPALPQALLTRPTLRWLIRSSQDGPQQLELTYLAQNLSWIANYNVLLAPDNTSLNLNGWVTLNNNSGTSYQNALLKLVAGDVNRIQPETLQRGLDVMATATMMAVPSPAPTVVQREIFEYQLYEVGRGVTIGNNESKQIEFVTAANVPAIVRYRYDSSPPFSGFNRPHFNRDYPVPSQPTVETILVFSTDEEGGVGADLPAGRVRIYQRDVDGAALFIRERFIDHTPEGEDVELNLGSATDLIGRRVQTNFELLSDTVLRESYRIQLRNYKTNQPVQIEVLERLFRWADWEIIEASATYQQMDAHTVAFNVEVPPQAETTITYTVQYRWRDP